MNGIIVVIGLGLAAGQPAPATSPKPPAESLRPEPGWKEMGRSLWFDPRERRAIVRVRVVLREGVLEHLLCRKGTKEHEAIVATDAVPRQIHATLILTGATAGNPVEFAPKFRPPSGTPMAIEMKWQQDGMSRTADAREWIWDEKTKAPLAIDWVFAGSVIYEDRITRQRMYAADEGDLITVANFASSILDLPIASSANDADRMFTANTRKIPPIGTEVFMILRPRRPLPRSSGPGEVGKRESGPAPPPSKAPGSLK